MLENIVIVSDSGNINGGNANVALTSARELSKGKAKLYLFCGTGPVEKFIEDSEIETICLNQKDILRDNNRVRAIVNGVYNKSAKREFEKLISRLNPKTTVVHFHSWSKVLSSSLFSVTAKYNIPIVITMHDYFSFCPNGGMYIYPQHKICHCKPMSMKCIKCNCDSRKYIYKLWRVARQVVQNKLLKRNKNITFVTISNLNEGLAKEHLSRYGRTVRINNPVNMNTGGLKDFRKGSQYAFIGRLSEEKGIDTFCDALSGLNSPGIVMGDGYKLDELRKAYPDITFTGWVNKEEINRRLGDVRALIFPSIWYEGAPLTITEMLSFGIPCIVSDACSAREMIKDGVNGYVFKSKDTEDLKDKILRLESNESMTPESVAESFGYDDYTCETHVGNLISLYNELVV